jgi:DDE superfamily endonuclease
MEEILDLYQAPADPQVPLVCTDEESTQLVADTRTPLAPCPAAIAREDHEYARNGTCNLFIAFAPLENWRHVQVTERRTALDWVHFVKPLADDYFPNAERIRIVMDNLNTHNAGSFYDAFEPPVARRRYCVLNFTTRPSMAVG